MSEITRFIKDCLGTWEHSAQTINSGLCDAFANTVTRRIEGAEVICGPWHVFLLYDRRYYDAEAPGGVDDPRDLPFYERTHASPRDWAWDGWRISGPGGQFIERDEKIREEQFPETFGDDIVARYRP